MNKRKRRFIGISLIIILALFGMGVTKVQAQGPTVALTILNPPNELGQIVLAQGDPVAVEYEITDPLGELSPFDIIRLVRIDNGQVVSLKKRGNSLIGRVLLRTWRGIALGELVVEYIHDHMVLVQAEPTVLVVSGQMIAEMLYRIAVLEETAQVPGPEGPQGPQREQILRLGEISDYET